MKFASYEPNRIRIFRCSCVKNFRESYVFHCLVIKVVCLCDSFAILSCCFQLVNNFFEVFFKFYQLFSQQLFKFTTAFSSCQELFSSFSKEERRRRDLNPRAAINDLLPFQGSPFGQLGYFSIVCLIHNQIFN